MHAEIRNIRLQKLYLITIFVLTTLLTITWQFAQFVLLLQTLVLFGLALIKILDKDKVIYYSVWQLHK